MGHLRDCETSNFAKVYFQLYSGVSQSQIHRVCFQHIGQQRLGSFIVYGMITAGGW